MVADELAARGAAVRIKWPNDLLVDGRKVGGILVEERGGVVVAGLGLNLGGAPRDHALRATPGAARRLPGARNGEKNDFRPVAESCGAG